MESHLDDGVHQSTMEPDSPNKQISENEVRVICKNCGGELKPNHSGSCPNYGKTDKNFVASSVAIDIKTSKLQHLQNTA